MNLRNRDALIEESVSDMDNQTKSKYNRCKTKKLEICIAHATQLISGGKKINSNKDRMKRN